MNKYTNIKVCPYESIGCMFVHEKSQECQKFDDMDDGEKYKVNEYICSNVCWQGDHKCFEKEREKK
jgi:hypothetical protein